MNLLFPFQDLLDRRASIKSNSDLVSLGKASGAALSTVLFVALDLADKAGALITDNRVHRYHLQSLAIVALLIGSIAIYTATEPGRTPAKREYKYSQAMRVVAKFGFIALAIAIGVRVPHVLPNKEGRYFGYVCDAGTGRPANAVSVSIQSIFDEPLGSASAIGTDGSFAVVVAHGGYEPASLLVRGACSGTIPLSNAKRGRGCAGDPDSPEANVWRFVCAQK